MLRRSITGETIKYNIAVDYYGTTYEGYLTEEQILKLASPSFDKGSNNVKLRLDKLSKSYIKTMLEDNGNITIIRNKGDGHSTLYSAIRA